MIMKIKIITIIIIRIKYNKINHNNINNQKIVKNSYKIKITKKFSIINCIIYQKL